jgi:hypothetical protein
MEQVISYIFGALAGVTAIGLFIDKISSGAKYIALAKDCIELIDEIMSAVKDKQLTEEEIKKIASEYSELASAFKEIRKK